MKITKKGLHNELRKFSNLYKYHKHEIELYGYLSEKNLTQDIYEGNSDYEKLSKKEKEDGMIILD